MSTNVFWNKWFLLPSVLLISNMVIAVEPVASLYSENCQGCHAADGRGSMGWVPDLTNHMAWMTMNEDELLNELKTGVRKSGEKMRMPAKGGNDDLSDEELRKIIHYMRKSIHK